jgi:ferritin
MKLSTKLETALNEQLNLELVSAYAYTGMAAYFQQTPFTGFEAWMELQSGEEVGHARKFFHYIGERNGKVKLAGLPEPKCEYKSVLQVFQTSLAHEQKVSSAICGIYELALAEKDFATLSFLKWFLDEQVEEEKSVSEMVSKLELVGDNRNGLFHLDKLAAKRGNKADADQT